MALLLGINELKYISESLTKKLGFDFSNYSLSFLKRRFAVVFDELNIKKIDLFIDSLDSTDFIEKFHYFFAVPASELFRDPSFWRALRFKVISGSDCENHIWFPDASSGEEVFSLLILLYDCGLIDKFQIHCNHLSKTKLDEIKAGILKDKNIDVNESNLKRFGAKGNFFDYFDVCEEGLKLKAYMLENVQVHHCHLSQQTFEIKPSITIFRNTMLYYTKKYCVEAMVSIYNSMCPKGFFAIGIKEGLPDSIINNMLPYDNNEQIYKRHPASVATI